MFCLQIIAPVITKVATPVVTKVAEDYDPNPQYSFAYDIHDGLTGDAKSQHETRNGDVVQGSYSLIDADGTRRTVDYVSKTIKQIFRIHLMNIFTFFLIRPLIQ